jgi:hypothetical protein
MIWKEVVMASLGTTIFYWGNSTRTQETSNMDSQCLGRKSNQTPSEQNACDPCIVLMSQWWGHRVSNPVHLTNEAPHHFIPFVAVFFFYFSRSSGQSS